MSSESAQPDLRLDPSLPVTAHAREISDALRDHQLVVIAGDTGSGKTTQLPKLCLAVGRRSIAHTQPRRIAARSVAERIASETHTMLGELVGYQVRFQRRAGRETRLKVLTDGVLLAEIGRDRDLRAYDTIIIDEAHERSLNIDFLLGYLKQLLPRRPELRVIITSATIDTQRFSDHFDGAPVIEVSGRTYPVEIRYRPEADDPEESDPIGAISSAVKELVTATDGDILVFLAGEREIRDTAEALNALELPRTEVLPLFSRLSAAEQHRIFSAHQGRRIVLATNIAETSLTVPGITSVIDPGTARISRYSTRTKVQRLPIEPISQASANQRAGRSGRTSPGICIRLYSVEDFESRPEFTQPEMLRTNLASVILRMADAGLGDIASFPFVEAPDSRALGDGLRLLHELGALRGEPRSGPVRLSAIGKRLARIPIDPRLGRMLLEADRVGCLREALIIVAGLSIVDPRERPAEHRAQADELHRRFWTADGVQAAEQSQPAGRHRRSKGSPQEGPTPADASDERSDFLSWLHLWDYLTERQKALSGSAFRRMCRDEFLHFLRIREWQDLHAQLRQISQEIELSVNERRAGTDVVHGALLSGLLSQIGLREVPAERGPTKGRRPLQEYLGTRGARFVINPGSALARTPPELVMAGELVETGRLWARTVAGISADQVREVGAHLLRHQYSEPHFSVRRGAVLARERVTLLGVPISNDTMVGYAKIDQPQAREIFIRSGLVEEQLRTDLPFFAHNREVRREASEMADRLRRPDLVDDDLVFRLYDQRLGPDVTSIGHLRSWLKRQSDPAALQFDLSELVADAGEQLRDFPSHWEVDELELPISYVFDPGADSDGVTVEVGLPVLHQLRPEPFSWQVPGLRTELAAALIRSLPKAQRTNFVPAPDVAQRALADIAQREVDPSRVGFPQAMATALSRLASPVRVEDFDFARLPDRLQVSFRVLDGDGQLVQAGTDLARLQRELRTTVGETLTAELGAAGSPVSQGQTSWTFGEIPAEVTHGDARGFPGLVDEGDAVGLRYHADPERAALDHRKGIARLLTLTTADPGNWVISRLSNRDKLVLTASPYRSLPTLVADARLRAVADLAAASADLVSIRDAEAFGRLREDIRADIAPRTGHVVATTVRILQAQAGVEQATQALGSGEVEADAARDVAEQLRNLIFDGFLGVTAAPWWEQLPRYLRGATERLNALPGSASRDLRGVDEIWPLEDAYATLVANQPEGPLPDQVLEIGWQLEELRVSLFAQALGTRFPVSAKRVRSAIARASAAAS